ncbi:MAG: hypothetical protein KDI06_14340 [Calditrichaeota bacterium]|nr:hypothetical protein [Calditrichota bacterium]HQU70660.1 hypothetical protein [Calditrichia bacterium]
MAIKLKTFSGSSLPHALKKAKDELGEEIVLMESRPAGPGDNALDGEFLVTVGFDETMQIKPWSPPRIDAPKALEGEKAPRERRFNPGMGVPKAYQQATQSKPRPRKSEDQDRREFNDVLSNILKKGPKEQDREKQILDELASLRQQLNDLYAKKETVDSDMPEPFKGLLTEMIHKGIREELATRLIRGAFELLEARKDITPSAVTKAIRLELQKIFKPYSFKRNPFDRKQERILLLGLTGVGKTVSAMKLAAHKDMFAGRKVAILSTETYGVTEELKTFARMTGLKVAEARSLDDVPRALEELEEMEVILVDTPGRSPYAANHLNELERYLKLVDPTDTFLVLGMSTDTRDLFLACGLYMLLKPTGLIFTKFDETTQPGKIFSVLEEINLPVVCLSEGERVFMDAMVANMDFVFNKVFETN